MAIDWRDTLRTLRTQFEAKAAASTGLHHLFVEVADDERDKMMGPSWFRPFDKHPRIVDGKPKYEKWDCSAFAGLPGVSPSFREVELGEDVSKLDQSKIIRDGSGVPRGIAVPMKLRQGFYCGPGADAATQFKSLASAAASALASATDLHEHPFGSDLKDLFRAPRGGVRYVFGEVTEQPQQFLSSGWNAGVLQYPNGVLIDMPIAESPPDESHWLLLIYRLGWRRVTGSILRAQRFSWMDNAEVAYEMLLRGTAHMGQQFAERFEQFSKESFYSVLGTKETPDDLFLASAFAINLLLSHLSDETDLPAKHSEMTDYSSASWHTQKLPVVKAISKAESDEISKPRVGILVATETEREAVLKRMKFLKSRRFVGQVFQGNNTCFVGRLGGADIVLCMTAMGTTSRDGSTIVTSEVIDAWNLSAVIMVGIAFGKDATMQRVGNVLIADRVIPYEPQRVGESVNHDRGIPIQSGPVLFNRFRNIVGWSFTDPKGFPSGYQVGPLLSGEKLVDNADFKRSLFDRYPQAIGGEMEGAGVAAAAERKRREWIVVKAICDWGDGTKKSRHQAFAAASAVHLVEHVLNQVGALEALVERQN